MNNVLFDLKNNSQIVEGIYSTGLEGLYYIDRFINQDERGFFCQTSIARLDQVLGERFQVVQVNHSMSKKNVIRGFHAEDWNKLVFVLTGEAFCTIADIDRNSKTYTHSVSIRLGQSNSSLSGALFITKGLANSICVLQEPVNYMYLVDQEYQSRDKSKDQAINLFDPQLSINWPIPKQQMIISDRDQNAINLEQISVGS